MIVFRCAVLRQFDGQSDPVQLDVEEVPGSLQRDAVSLLPSAGEEAKTRLARTLHPGAIDDVLYSDKRQLGKVGTRAGADWFDTETSAGAHVVIER